MKTICGRMLRRLASAAAGIGVAICVAQVQLSRFWLGRFRFGPLEWLWRSLAYGRRQPMRRAQTHVEALMARPVET
jgi:uncharacterized protein